MLQRVSKCPTTIVSECKAKIDPSQIPTMRSDVSQSVPNCHGGFSSVPSLSRNKYSSEMKPSQYIRLLSSVSQSVPVCPNVFQRVPPCSSEFPSVPLLSFQNARQKLTRPKFLQCVRTCPKVSQIAMVAFQVSQVCRETNTAAK